MLKLYVNALLVLSMVSCATSSRTPIENQTTEKSAREPNAVLTQNIEATAVATPEGSTVQPKGASQKLFDAALVAFERDDFVKAESLLLEVTRKQPDLSGPWVNLGQIYMHKNQLEEAGSAFRKAIKANANNCAAYTQLGVLSRQAGDFAGAEQYYVECLKRVPDYQDALLNIGILYDLYLGRLEEALLAYQRYQELETKPSRRIAGWVVDLERRIGSRS